MLKKVDGRTGTSDSRSVGITVKDIPVGDILIKENVRKEYSGIDELAESIREHGLLQPITVYPDKDDYVVKTGHRRFQAYQSLCQIEPERFHSIRCIVSDAKNIAVIQLVENVQRVDLSQIDLVNALNALRNEGLANKHIAEVMGKTEGYVNNLFMGVNEINHNQNLASLVTHAGVSILDVAETKGIPDYKDRVNLLEERKKGTINRAKMRQKIRELKGGGSVGDGEIAEPEQTDLLPQSEPSVKLTVSPNGLTIKLTFNSTASAKLLETGIRRLLGRHQVKVMV
jgi:ParB family chromosome partitioning protein